MGRPKSFKIIEVQIKSGIRFAASGTVNGRQSRRRFDTYAKADTYLDSLKVEDARLTNKAQLQLTRLSVSELQDAESALEFLKESHPDKSLKDTVSFLIKNYQEELIPATFEEIEAPFTSDNVRDWSARTIRDYKNLFKKLKLYFRNKSLDQIYADDLIKYVESHAEQKLADKTWNNYKGFFNKIFDWASDDDRRHCQRPTSSSKLPFYKIYYGSPEVLTVDECVQLMKFAEEFRDGELVNTIALLLFAGIRPGVEKGEIFNFGGKIDELRYFNLKTKRIFLDAYMTKTNTERKIQIQPNLVKWLTTYPLSDFPIVPRGQPEDVQIAWLNYRMKKFREKCPVKLGHDVLRHTFATFRAAGTDSLVAYLQEAGHTEKIALNHYLDRTTPEETKAFWAISPSRDTP